MILLDGLFFHSTSLVNSSTMESIFFSSFLHHLDSKRVSGVFVYLVFLLRFLDVKYLT